jgi:general secretion pathway protein H
MRKAGFTLIELLVVLAILGLGLMLVAAYRAPESRTLSLHGMAVQLAGQLRLARAQAIAGNAPVAVSFDLAANAYRVGGGPLQRLPARQHLTLLTIAAERQGATIGGIRFNPDGSATGGGLVLSDGPQRVAIRVDWLTGGISVSDGG